MHTPNNKVYSLTDQCGLNLKPEQFHEAIHPENGNRLSTNPFWTQISGGPHYPGTQLYQANDICPPTKNKLNSLSIGRNRNSPSSKSARRINPKLPEDRIRSSMSQALTASPWDIPPSHLLHNAGKTCHPLHTWAFLSQVEWQLMFPWCSNNYRSQKSQVLNLAGRKFSSDLGLSQSCIQVWWQPQVLLGNCGGALNFFRIQIVQGPMTHQAHARIWIVWLTKSWTKRLSATPHRRCIVQVKSHWCWNSHLKYSIPIPPRQQGRVNPFAEC